MALKQRIPYNPGCSNTKFVGSMDKWAKVAGELEGEDLKQKIYDNRLLNLIGSIEGKNVLDYGAGPGVVASRMARMDGDVHVFDISAEMLEKAAEKLGSSKTHSNILKITNGTFDVVVCNLVVCIVPENEVVRIARNIRAALAPHGKAYIGFCNPRLYNVPETLIDFRHPTGEGYEDNHRYSKTKKEGNYQIVELHRPIGWYNGIWAAVGLKLKGTFFTPGYSVTGQGSKINDFVIFHLQRGEMP